jgi:hypothetical protein
MSQSDPNENHEVQIIQVGSENMAQTQSLFYNAYLETDIARTLLRAGKRGYEQRLRGFIRETLIHHYNSANISLAMVKDDQIIGAAMVSRANCASNFISSWRWRLGMYSVAGVVTTERIRSYYKDVQDILSDVDSYWISLKAFRPENQQSGGGRILLRAVHDRCELDPSFKGIGIDVSKPELKTFFESEGYTKMGEVKVGNKLTASILYHPRAGTEVPAEM